MNAIGFGPDGRPGFAFGFGDGAASLKAWRIASSWAWVIVPLVTRPSRIAFILSFGWSRSATALVGVPTVVLSDAANGWKPARATPPMNVVLKAPAATASDHLFDFTAPSRKAHPYGIVNAGPTRRCVNPGSHAAPSGLLTNS